jgi:hypothetical protein
MFAYFARQMNDLFRAVLLLQIVTGTIIGKVQYNPTGCGLDSPFFNPTKAASQACSTCLSSKIINGRGKWNLSRTMQLYDWCY